MRPEYSIRIAAWYFLVLAAIIGLAAIATADVPHLSQYQGRLTDDAGNPLDTVVDMTITIFSDSLGTTAIWTETQDGVTVVDGLFCVLLGSVNPLDAADFSGSALWMGIALGEGDYMAPLTPIVSTAYACRSEYAAHATTAGHADTADIALGGSGNGWVDAGTTVRLETVSDSVGIGTSDPRVPLEVQGSVTAIIGESHGSGISIGVHGGNDSDGIGVMGTSNDGRGVSGISITGFGGHFYGAKNYFNKNLGIGTESPEEMLHIYQNVSGGSSFLKLQSDHATNWGETGLRFETPQNRWHFRMDDDANNNMPSGGLGLRSHNLDAEVMTWRENGNIGIGTTSPNYPLEVVSSGNTLRARCTGGGVGVYASSSSGFGVYSDADKNFMGGLTGFGQTNPTHRVTVNGSLALQSSGTTKYHLGYMAGGLNFVETTVADYRLFIKDGGNVGIGTNNPTSKLYVNGNTHVAGIFHADAFESNAIADENIKDEVGVASAAGDIYGEDVATSYAPYLTCEITVPDAGYVFALGSARFRLDHDITGSTSAYLACSDQSNALNNSYPQSVRLSSTVNAGIFYFSVTCQRLFSVPASGTYTYYLIAESGSDNPVEIGYKQIRLLFIPSSYASKGGKNIACPVDNAPSGLETSDNDIIQTAVNQSGESSARLSSDDGGVVLLQRIEDLTAKIESLESRLQAVEKK